MKKLFIKQKKEIAGKLLGFVLALAMVTGLLPVMNMTAYASTNTVGNTDNTSLYGTAVTQELTLTNDMVAKFSFTNYTDQVNNWDNWSTFVSSTSGSFTAGYRFRADAWEDEKWTDTNVTHNYNWDIFKEEMDGADAETMQMFKEEGRQEGQTFVIRNMLQSGMPAEDVSRLSGVSLDNVMKIQGDM